VLAIERPLDRLGAAGAYNRVRPRPPHPFGDTPIAIFTLFVAH
jgi:hypothetical protein